MNENNNITNNLLDNTCKFIKYYFTDKTISSLVSCLISSIITIDDSQNKEHIIQTINIMGKKILNMPKYIKFSILVLTLFFDWYGLFAYKKRFHRQSIKEQICQISSWKKSKIRILRDFVSFYEKMTMFVYYSISTS